MKVWMRIALAIVVLAVVVEKFIIGSSDTEKFSRNILQRNLENQTGNVLTETGKLQYSGYLPFPTLNWDSSLLTSTVTGKLRFKKWDFYAVYAENVTICVALADLGYFQNAFITVYEKNQEPITYEKLIPFWDQGVLSDSAEVGKAFYNSSSFFVSFDNHNKNYKTIVARNEKVDIDLVFEKNSEQESMVYLGPFNEEMTQFFYSQKVYNYKVNGMITVENRKYELQQELGMLDWARSIWPYQGGWIWASGMGKYDNKNIALNLGELLKAKNATEATDDCIIVDNKLIKLGVVNADKSPKNENIWEFYTINSEPTEKYASIKGTFKVEKIFYKNINLWVFQSLLHQHFGEFEGKVITLDGSFSFKIRGMLEVYYCRW